MAASASHGGCRVSVCRAPGAESGVFERWISASAAAAGGGGAQPQTQPQPSPSKTAPEPLPQTIFFTEKRGDTLAEPPREP